MYGVNLPSKNVVIRDYTRWTGQGPQPIPVFDYEQMSGRAGRPGYDDEGYSYLIAKSVDEAFNLKDHYIYGEIETTNSKLIENRDAVYKQIITQVASSLAKSPQEILEFFNDTFYGFQMSHNEYMAKELTRKEILSVVEPYYSDEDDLYNIFKNALTFAFASDEPFKTANTYLNNVSKFYFHFKKSIFYGSNASMDITASSLQSSNNLFLMDLCALLLPNRTPWGTITAHLPPVVSTLYINSKNRISVLVVFIEKSSFNSSLFMLPLNGGLARTTSYSDFCSYLVDRVFICSI